MKSQTSLIASRCRLEQWAKQIHVRPVPDADAAKHPIRELGDPRLLYCLDSYIGIVNLLNLIRKDFSKDSYLKAFPQRSMSRHKLKYLQMHKFLSADSIDI